MHASDFLSKLRKPIRCLIETKHSTGQMEQLRKPIIIIHVQLKWNSNGPKLARSTGNFAYKTKYIKGQEDMPQNKFF